MKDDSTVLDRPAPSRPSANSNLSQQANDTLALARRVYEIEAESVLSLKERLDKNFLNACDAILACRGRVVVCGIGKSGHIANKIAATLASTGTPSFFVHPSEASHGDFGMIKSEDVVIAISYSGESDELKTILPLLKRMGNTVIAFTGRSNSSLSKAASIHLDISVKTEACPLGLAPTSSTTATLATGDALAVAVLNLRGFSANDFARTHPGGALGKRLLLNMTDVMVSGNAIPAVNKSASVKEALLEMSTGQLGFLIVTDQQNKLAGVFSDGDLRRALDGGIDINTTRITEVMTKGGHSVQVNQPAVKALELMEKHKIYALPVLDENQCVCGALNMHSLLQAGVVQV